MSTIIATTVAQRVASAGTTITVTTTADDNTVNGNCTLREAIQAYETQAAVDACPAGVGLATVLVPAGTYTLTLGELVLHGSDNIVGAGTASTIIDGGGADNGGRIFHVAYDASGPTISDMTLRHATSAIRNDTRQQFTLTKVNIVSNGAPAVDFDPTELAASGLDNRGYATLTNVLFSGNGDTVNSDDAPPTIANAAGATVNMTSSTIRNIAGGNNDTGNSDSTVINAGTMTITKTAFDSAVPIGNYPCSCEVLDNSGTVNATLLTVTNSAPVGGALIGNDNTGRMTLDQTVSANNDSADVWNDGVLYVTNSTLPTDVINGSDIPLDRAANLQIATSTVGGLNSVGTATVVNVTINKYGVANNGGTMTVRNATITGTVGGWGLWTNGGTFRIANSIAAGSSKGDCKGTISSLGYNLIQKRPSGCTITGTATGNRYGVSPKLGSLANNGGPTLTEMPLPGSPAIDAGNPAKPGTRFALCPLFDQRGVARPRDGNGDGIKRCDIGAVEK